MADKERINHFATIAIFGALAGFGTYIFDRQSKPDPNFQCSFTARPNAASVRLGDLRGPLAKIDIAGYLGEPFGENLYDFDGLAKLVVNGKLRSYFARGSVFIWQPGKVGDLSITVAADEHARRDFTLITFDKKGSLSKNPDEAFAFDDPNLKLVHPMTYRCSFIGPLPKPTQKNT